MRDNPKLRITIQSRPTAVPFVARDSGFLTGGAIGTRAAQLVPAMGWLSGRPVVVPLTDIDGAREPRTLRGMFVCLRTGDVFGPEANQSFRGPLVRRCA